MPSEPKDENDCIEASVVFKSSSDALFFGGIVSLVHYEPCKNKSEHLCFTKSFISNLSLLLLFLALFLLDEPSKKRGEKDLRISFSS